ncbi:MAG TPA: MipA/OmpV family protein [Castellaniella sp.]|uniref:MipA/OmpV family protein n=1 Tax=Castellaniella sp. TaxID=1955812 RepID=UPI002EF53C63
MNCRPRLHPSVISAQSGFGCVLLTLAALFAQTAQADNTVALGVGMAVQPNYEGARDYRAKPFPIINAESGPFFAQTGEGFYNSTDNGLGLKLINTPSFTFGVGASIMWGYDQDDVPPGIGGVPDALGANAFMSTNLSDYVLRLSATQAVTHQDRGLLLNAKVSYPYAATSALTLTPSISTSWGNQKYMSSYFGISPQAGASSGLGAYAPSSGIKDVSVGVSAKYAVTDRFSLTGSIGADRVLGQAADSPLVEQKTQMRSTIGGSYAF